MGKRKERRLCAKTAANRRVKLDLIAEPSGDFGDLSNQEDVEDGGNGKNHAGSLNSPSSSGQRPENPLLLLGQYSDEELEEESSKEVNQDTRENSPTMLDEKVKVDNHDSKLAVEVSNHITENFDEENKVPCSSIDAEPNLEKNTVIEDKGPDLSHRDTDTMERASGSLITDMQATEDGDSGWKMVLHEESNSYYYWNTFTGQTSWEIPVALTQGNESSCDPKSGPKLEEAHANSIDVQPNNGPANNMLLDTEGINTTEKYPDVMTNGLDAVSNVGSHHNDSVIQDVSGVVYQVTGGESSDYFHLLQLAENLSERLKSLKGSEGFSDTISKLSFELDIRLADIKSLIPYGSSLLPFWLHCENQLKTLETSINNEVSKFPQFTVISEVKEPESRFENAITPVDIEPNVGPHMVEDNDDMDVEMEVEDAAIPPKDETGPHPDQDSSGPPPPNTDWVPPPPPDEEPLPPPPPDEPPEAAPQPPLLEAQTTEPYSYGEQYGFTYPGSGFEYYGQTNNEIPGNGYYVDANGSQIAASIPTVYYQPVLNPEPVTYYTLQETPSTAPVTGGIESSSLKNPIPESSSVTRDGSAASAPLETVPKVQTKVTRIKKRTIATVPTLRSNKKVSGLVDKWKAVKEELHEDEEDEPENPLEVMEKKRQREIEQWHAQQIASGEAKDNANFQPLGGDWRERIRRKRAKKPEENATNTSGETNQQPDLGELSKQLPTGWQAYWDESTKQVYYGNAVTSETTWTKPTK